MSYSLSSSNTSFMSAELKERMEYFDSIIQTKTKKDFEQLAIYELYSDIKTAYYKICGQINDSNKATDIWLTTVDKNTYSYIMDIFLSHYKESIIKPNDAERLALVLSDLKRSLKTRRWNQKMRYLRDASNQFVKTTIKYTGFSALVKFDYKEGDMTTLETMDVYDMFNAVSDVVSILCVNEQTYLVQTLQPNKVYETCEQINGKDVIVEADNITGKFNITAKGFQSKNPIVKEFSWKEQKTRSFIIVPTNKKVDKHSISSILNANKKHRSS